LVEHCRECTDARLKTRSLIILSLAETGCLTETARAWPVSRRTVSRVAERFRATGEAGLVDRREENGRRKVDADDLGLLYEVVASSPADHGWKRPTWTRELLVQTLGKETGVWISVGRMSRALAEIGARRGRPKPTAGCPGAAAEKERELQASRDLVDQLPPDEVAVYADEVDVHLNPKLGLDWMVRGQQKTVRTPGRNEKRDLAGAQDVRTGELLWVEGDQKHSLLFIRLLWQLVQRYPEARTIPVILDNYAIHSTQQVELSLASPAGARLDLHFLPPYCPDDNKIERTWQDLHANVTRNHTCAGMDELMHNVRNYLRRRNYRKRQPQTRIAA
jgi:transposase